ncbi:MAG: superoxide dismutase family protein [Rhodospirillaceae bacterium]
MTALRICLAALALAAVAASPALAQQQQEAAGDLSQRLATQVAPPEGVGGPVVAMSQIMTRDGLQVGAASFQAAPNGTLVRIAFAGVDPGPKGFHVHQTGVCQADFQSAGGHLDTEGRSHGFWHAQGPHGGDFPNVHVPESGDITVVYFNERLKMDETVFDADGSALVLHAKADDYRSQPAGESGDRIACGVIERLMPQAAETPK